MSGQSPPTTSGITIISGSNNFNVLNSDFPVVTGGVIQEFTILVPPEENRPFLISTLDVTLLDESFPVALTLTQSELLNQVTLIGGFIPDLTDDVSITSTTVTTSGITILEFFPGAGLPEVPFIPPTVLNARLFPIFSTAEFVRTFPEENRRIFPVLPQFSTLTPGD